MPTPPTADRRWFAVSAGIHAALLVLLVALSSRTFTVERTVTMIPLDTAGTGIQFPRATPKRITAQSANERAPAPAGHPVEARPSADTAVAVVPRIQLIPAPVAVVAPPLPDTTPRKVAAVPPRGTPRGRGAGGRDSTASVGTHRLLGPRLTPLNAPVWDEARRLALDMLRAGQAGVTKGEVPDAKPLDSTERREKMDSVVKERLRRFMAALPPDSMAAPKPQSWTDTINGKPWGMDGQWIYLGDIKIPTAILALLPFPSGNYDQAQQAKSLQFMRDDIMQAAARAQTNEDFQRYLKEERARHDAERSAEKERKAQMPKDTVIKQ